MKRKAIEVDTSNKPRVLHPITIKWNSNNRTTDNSSSRLDKLVKPKKDCSMQKLYKRQTLQVKQRRATSRGVVFVSLPTKLSQSGPKSQISVSSDSTSSQIWCLVSTAVRLRQDRSISTTLLMTKLRQESSKSYRATLDTFLTLIYSTIHTFRN